MRWVSARRSSPSRSSVRARARASGRHAARRALMLTCGSLADRVSPSHRPVPVHRSHVHSAQHVGKRVRTMVRVRASGAGLWGKACPHVGCPTASASSTMETRSTVDRCATARCAVGARETACKASLTRLRRDKQAHWVWCSPRTTSPCVIGERSYRHARLPRQRAFAPA
jgi:hypothetical protein